MSVLSCLVLSCLVLSVCLSVCLADWLSVCVCFLASLSAYFCLLRLFLFFFSTYVFLPSLLHRSIYEKIQSWRYFIWLFPLGTVQVDSVVFGTSFRDRKYTYTSSSGSYDKKQQLITVYVVCGIHDFTLFNLRQHHYSSDAQTVGLLRCKSLSLSPPAVKTQWFSQSQAFQRLVRSSHTIVSKTFDLLNQISLASFWKHWMLFASVCNINTLGQ
jgi:hypothetical protein